MEILREEVDRELQGQDMVPPDSISNTAGHRHLQLLKHLCSLFMFVSLYQACKCIHVYACVAFVYVCMCVFVWSRKKAEIKATREEIPSNQKRRHKASHV